VELDREPTGLGPNDSPLQKHRGAFAEQPQRRANAIPQVEVVVRLLDVHAAHGDVSDLPLARQVALGTDVLEWNWDPVAAFPAPLRERAHCTDSR